ncbi:hypothetical protein BGZ65_010430 [Modicella reniformis]|uniref:Uncharacterized protein n=1 Tax=Modicella reniformis TaxID=1440133 RepID=A0A9P6JFS2_9FUNG|nr:hypothetical protein BGZ65_010430 [Modicella reniformis]
MSTSSSGTDLPSIESSSRSLTPPASDDAPLGANEIVNDSETHDTEAESSAPNKRPIKKTVSRFDFRKESLEELLLLRALAQHRPSIAPHGTVVETWDKVVTCLHDSDKKDRPNKPMFANVKRRTCQLTCDRLMEEQKKYETYLISATGIAPEETERRLLMGELFRLKQATNAAAAEARVERTRQQENATEERRLGEMLLESAESGTVRRREDSDTENSVSTRYSKKRLTIQHLEKQLKEALDQVMEQRRIMAQQLALQEEYMQLRRQRAATKVTMEREKEEREVERELAKEQRVADREEDREKAREEYQRSRDIYDDRRHKEVMELAKLQSSSTHLLIDMMGVIKNMIETSKK